MAEKTAISWTDHTFNPWWGCVKVSPACKFCYAERDSKRYGYDLWGPDSERRFFSDDHWKAPLKWNAQAKALGIRRRVFCASMADVFEVPIFSTDDATKGRELRERLDRERMRLFWLIEATPRLHWLLLTKRPHYVAGRIPAWWRGNWPEHVAIGTTVETQGWLEDRIEALLGLAAKVRFLSIEPQLGAIDLRRVLLRGELGEVYVDVLTGCHTASVTWSPLPTRKRPIEWVIAGGESGTNPEIRPSHPDWFRALRDGCVRTGTPFHFKQWGEWRPAQGGDIFNTLHGRAGKPPAFLMREDGTVHCTREAAGPEAVAMVRVGKRAAGRLLDGCEWNEFPKEIAC